MPILDELTAAMLQRALADEPLAIPVDRVTAARAAGFDVNDAGVFASSRAAMVLAIRLAVVDGEVRPLRQILRRMRDETSAGVDQAVAALPARQTELENHKTALDGLDLSDGS